MSYDSCKFSDLIGNVIVSVNGAWEGSEVIEFICVDGTRYKMFHYQDCCESVTVNDIVGDVEDIIGTVVLDAYESSKVGSDDEYGSSTWTFYSISTINGSINIRWLGESNGYYSEGVSFEKL